MPTSSPTALRSARLPLKAIWMIGVHAVLLSSVAAADVLVVTDSHHPVHRTGDARVIELDLPTRVEADLAANLPADPEQASALVQRRLRDGGSTLQRRIAHAYQGVTDAWALGVAKVPAVVVDRRYVVYGEPDVARAVAHIRTYRGTQP